VKRAILAGLLLAGCGTPTTLVRTPDTRPALAVSGAPEGARLLVDANDVGPAAAYDGRPGVLRLEPGVHVVAVRDGTGRVVFTEKVFLESELKTLEVR
jgi:hypothetical protein